MPCTIFQPVTIVVQLLPVQVVRLINRRAAAREVSSRVRPLTRGNGKLFFLANFDCPLQTLWETRKVVTGLES